MERRGRGTDLVTASLVQVGPLGKLPRKHVANEACKPEEEARLSCYQSIIVDKVNEAGRVQRCCASTASNLAARRGSWKWHG